MNEMNVEMQLQGVEDELEDIDNEFAVAGFSVEQWDLIKRYVLIAITRQELMTLRSVQSLGEDQSGAA